MKHNTKTVLALSKVHTALSNVAYIEQYKPDTETGLMTTRLVYTNGTTETALFNKDIKAIENVFDIINEIKRSSRLTHNMSIRTKD